MRVFVIAALLFSFQFALSAQAESPKGASQTVDVKVTEKGFEPSTIDVKPGVNLTLKVTRTTDATCATAVQVASKKIKEELPLNKPVLVKIGKVEKGEIRFTCGMDMITGQIIAK